MPSAKPLYPIDKFKFDQMQVNLDVAWLYEFHRNG